MLITLFTVLLSFLFFLYSSTFAVQMEGAPLALLIGTGGGLILVLTVLLNTSSLTPLATLEQKLIPNLMDLFRRHKGIRLGRILLFLFPIVSIFFAVLMLIPSIPHKNILLIVWVITFAIAIDLLRDCYKGILNFLNPTFLVKEMQKEGISAIQQENDELLWNVFDSISEVALRSIEKSKIALGTQAVQTYPPILKTFFESSKGISRINVDASFEKETGSDEASYAVFYILQRLELCFDRALEYRLESICRQLVMSLGKIIVYSAKFDMSMVSFPTHFITKFGLKAQQHHFDEVAVLTTSTILEISKTIVNDIDLSYAELVEPFKSIITGLDAIAQATFKKNKNTSISVLIDPFQQLKALFVTEKMANHPDTPAILANIDRVLEEYETLEKVMKSIPPIPAMGDDFAVPPLPPGS